MPRKGLINNGNTCFLNAALQMLISNTDFNNIIIANRHVSPNLQIMADFIKEYHNNSDTISPHAVKLFVENINNIFQGNQQHDAGEFVISILDILNDDLQNRLNNIYGITIKSTIKCKRLKCLNKTYSSDRTNILSLQINNEDNELDDCYTKFKSREKLIDDEAYFCENCNQKGYASKRLEINEWSPHLIIMLKRFQNINGRLSKNNQDIEIPLEWRHNFKIKGAIIHSGSINGGHYIYISKNNTRNNWDECDDRNIRSITNIQAENMLRKAYIIYYSQN